MNVRLKGPRVRSHLTIDYLAIYDVSLAFVSDRSRNVAFAFIFCEQTLSSAVITARRRCCMRVMFLYLSVILFTGGGWDTPPLGRPPRQTHPGQTPPQVDTPQAETSLDRHPQADTPPPEMATEGAVRILLECILVGLGCFIPRAYILVELIYQPLQGGFEPIV